MTTRSPPTNILDRPLGRPRSTAEPSVSLSIFALLFSEMVQYHQNRVDSITELERRLESSGYGVGLKVLELLAVRSREYRRETKLMNLLQQVSTVVWKALFGKAADSLERSIDHADEFMIIDYAPITRYVSCDVVRLTWLDERISPNGVFLTAPLSAFRPILAAFRSTRIFRALLLAFVKEQAFRPASRPMLWPWKKVKSGPARKRPSFWSSLPRPFWIGMPI